MPDLFKDIKTDYRWAAAAAIYGVLLIGLYYSTLEWLVLRGWTIGDYSHCMLVPVIVAYLIWLKRGLLMGTVSKPSWTGVGVAVLGMCLFWIGELAGEYYTLYISLWLVVFGLCYAAMGWEKIRIILFPLVFSLAMFPFPAFINNRITLQLKILSSKIGVVMMQIYGISAYREGNIIDLGFTKLQVVDACSGLRYLFPMIVLSILIAYFYKARLWKKIVIVLSSTPLTVFSNSLRIALSGILSEQFGTQAVEGFFHDFEGWLIFMMTLAAIGLEIWLLKILFPDKMISGADLEKDMGKDDRKRAEIIIDKKPLYRKPQFVFSVIFLAANLSIAYGFEFRESVPMNKPFASFPLNQSEWVGTPQPMEQSIVDELDFTDYVMVDYKNNDGRVINLYIAYYESQRKGESIHSPSSCLRGGGWEFEQAGKGKIKLNNGTTISVNRAVIQKDSIKQLAFYWFPARGRIITNEIQMKAFNFWDGLTRQRSDGALVRVITLVYPDETVEAAEERMRIFITDFNPVLSEYLPQ
jgi:exosortase D (VPLPA-CTERM-specific)